VEREILFRGKVREGGHLYKTWTEGSLIVDGDKCWILSDINSRKIEIDPDTKSQYTGYDFKNRKLFDGDILQFKDTQTLRYVCWYQGKWIVADQKDCKGDNMDLHSFCYYQSDDSKFNFVGTIWDDKLG